MVHMPEAECFCTALACPTLLCMASNAEIAKLCLQGCRQRVAVLKFVQSGHNPNHRQWHDSCDATMSATISTKSAAVGRMQPCMVIGKLLAMAIRFELLRYN